MTIARRFLYDSADAARLDALANSSFQPLRELVDKIRREERYHLMHATTWLERLADREGEPRTRLLAALDELGPDAATVLTPLRGEPALVEAGVLAAPIADVEARWRATLTPLFVEHGLPMPPPADLSDGRTRHGEAFRWLWGEFTQVRRLDPVAAW
jgi:ring-1,2-phenylacetyl-CoA epoxidase subunit PaaC